MEHFFFGGFDLLYQQPKISWIIVLQANANVTFFLSSEIEKNDLNFQALMTIVSTCPFASRGK